MGILESRRLGESGSSGYRSRNPPTLSIIPETQEKSAATSQKSRAAVKQIPGGEKIFKLLGESAKQGGHAKQHTDEVEI